MLTIRPKKYRLQVILATLGFVGLGIGAYGLLLVLSPIASPAISVAAQVGSSPDVTNDIEKISSTDRIIIPKINLNFPFKSGSAAVLDNAIWHRYPERGDPEHGGNFILAGHRFTLAPTPNDTIRKSPLYHLEQVAVGDQIAIDYHSKRYIYVVSALQTVTPSQIEVEAPTPEPRLTLYTCTLGGSNDGRNVIIATPKAF